jgi:DoxX-like family
MPSRLKEWAYAGFGIILVSASVAHASSGDPVANVVEPLAFLGVLMLSNVYWHKLTREQG